MLQDAALPRGTRKEDQLIVVRIAIFAEDMACIIDLRSGIARAAGPAFRGDHLLALSSCIFCSKTSSGTTFIKG
jgi:hypothetical protein